MLCPTEGNSHLFSLSTGEWARGYWLIMWPRRFRVHNEFHKWQVPWTLEPLPKCSEWGEMPFSGAIRHIRLSEHKCSATRRKKWTVDGWIPAFQPGHTYFKFQSCPEKEIQVSHHALEDSLPFLLYSPEKWGAKELFREGGMISLQKRSCVSYFSYSQEEHVFKTINIYIGHKQLSQFFPLKNCVA